MNKAAKSGYMASLDGWRALSILAVLANHSTAFTLGSYSFRSLQDFGGNGVYIFFAISGLLICSRLLEEEDILGRINLKGFYIRRVLRIQPAAIAYLLAVAVVMLAGWVIQDWKYWTGALLLYRNFQIDLLDPTGIRGHLTGHFWTLAVEEHFYLLLSLFLFFVRTSRLFWVTLSFIASILWVLLSRHFALPYVLNVGFWHTDLQLQFLIPGALFALLLRRSGIRAWAINGYILYWCLASRRRWDLYPFSCGIDLALFGLAFTHS